MSTGPVNNNRRVFPMPRLTSGTGSHAENDNHSPEPLASNSNRAAKKKTSSTLSSSGRPVGMPPRRATVAPRNRQPTSAANQNGPGDGNPELPGNLDDSQLGLQENPLWRQMVGAGGANSNGQRDPSSAANKLAVAGSIQEKSGVILQVRIPPPRPSQTQAWSEGIQSSDAFDVLFPAAGGEGPPPTFHELLNAAAEELNDAARTPDAKVGMPRVLGVTRAVLQKTEEAGTAGASPQITWKQIAGRLKALAEASEKIDPRSLTAGQKSLLLLLPLLLMNLSRPRTPAQLRTTLNMLEVMGAAKDNPPPRLPTPRMVA